MKILLMAILFFKTSTSNKIISIPASLECVLTSDKKVYNIGEIPSFSVNIINNTNSDIYLIGSLDGSDLKWRFPYCYFTVEKPNPLPDSLLFGRCATLNPLRVPDFKLVKAGQKFNPYENIDNHGFFTDYTITNKETFKSKGIYKLTFHYSTNDQNLANFRTYKTSKSDSLQIETLFKKVPKIELESNTIEIKIE